ncbi:MAG: CapA family protein [Deltaproteobacteria bacterium]|nr:CapA family protein [Deltaproteobacteria bacterium]
MLLLSLVALSLAAPPAEELAAGMAAQRAGDIASAKAHYAACLAQEPASVPCHWELGWSLWSEGDWGGVVQQWEQVKALDPAHPQVDRHLPQARGHLDSLALIQRAAAGAPDTVRVPLPAGKTLRIRAAGDVMMGTDFPHPTDYLPPNDGADLLAGVIPLLRDADMTFVNLEGPLCDTGTTDKCAPGQNCYAFRTPTRYGDYLVAAGVDVVSTANNHAEDFGQRCRLETEAALDARGIAYSGRPGTVASLDVDGVKVGVIGFHSSASGHNLNDLDTAAALVRAVAASNDLVLVSFHGGAEGSKATHVPQGGEVFYGERRGDLRAFAQVVVEAGADLVVGHGPHVPRGMELIDGHLVAYSLGNFATYGRFSLGGHLSTSLVLEVVLDRDGRLVQGKILPVRLEGKGVPVPDPEGVAIDLIRSLTEEDFPGRGPVIAKDGSLGPG